MKNKIKVLYKEGNPYRMEVIAKGDWIDVYLPERATFLQGEYKLLELKFAAKLPAGYEAHVLPRSSTFGKHGIILGNSMGIIDNTYCGNDDTWKFPAYATRGTYIEAGTRIGQFRIQLSQKATIWQRVRDLFCNGVELVEVDELSDKARGGIGSTGV